MLLRRLAPLALPLAVASCTPDVGARPEDNPTQIQNAVFDPATNQIPLPNDLALTPQALASQKGAQLELLQSFAAPCPGSASALPCGFPSDQEVPITIDFVQIDIDPATGAQTRSKPDLDLSTINICTAPGSACSLAVIGLPRGPGAPLTFIPVDQPVAADYVQNGDHGTLTLHRSFHAVASGAPGSTINTRAWDAGLHIVAAVRGGPNGVKVQGGKEIHPEPAMFLLEQGKSLADPANQALLPGNTPQEKAANGAALEQIRQLYASGPFPAVNTVFPTTDIAVMTTFQVQPTGAAAPVIDASSGTVPLPSNLLLDGSTLPEDPFAPATNARVANLPGAFGALAPGFATLDGFSTTALLLIPLSGPAIVATGATPTSTFTNNVFLFDLTDPRNPVQVNPATYDELLPSAARQQVQPGVFASSIVGLQPASAAKPGTIPLKDATEYAVIVTNRIKSLPNQAPLARSSVANIILFDNPVYANGQSLLAGVPAPQAKILERMRAQIANVLPKLAAFQPATTKADIALAYTFRTQTIISPALQLAAAPYADPARSTQVVPIDGLTAVLTPADAFTKYGVDPTVVPGTAPTDFIDEIIETAIPTSNLLSGATGAFDPALLTPTASPPVEVLKTLIVVPKVGQVTPCPTPPFPAGSRCAPLVVFHHGLNGSRAQMLLAANALAQKGFVVAAIDAPKHGSRTWCTADTDCVAPPGGTANGGPPTCTPIPGGTAQGDVVPPGTCTNGSVPATNPVLCTTAACALGPGRTDGVAIKSANFLISGNLFRTRDSFRQGILDNSSLILALARPPPSPALPATPSNIVTTLLQGKQIIINPAQVFWIGQSLGGILGTTNVAANSRISEAVLNVAGGTFVDIAITSPAFASLLGSVLGTIPPPIGPIAPGSPAFLQFVQVAKWAFDPFDPINFGGHLLGGPAHPTLPDLLNGGQPQVAKKVLGQFAACDAVVPNAWNALLFNVIGLGATSTTTSTMPLYANSANAGAACVLGVSPNPGTAHHGFLLDWGATANPPSPLPVISPNDEQLTIAGQADAANFLANPTILPAPLITRP
ncbi:MAG: hypothetical protein ACJ787_10910 [Myxococcales bacterium]